MNDKKLCHKISNYYSNDKRISKGNIFSFIRMKSMQGLKF